MPFAANVELFLPMQAGHECAENRFLRDKHFPTLHRQLPERLILVISFALE